MRFSVRIVVRENFGTIHTGTATVIVIIQICSPEKRKQDEHVFRANDFKINLHIGPPKHALNKSYRYASYNKNQLKVNFHADVHNLPVDTFVSSKVKTIAETTFYRLTIGWNVSKRSINAQIEINPSYTFLDPFASSCYSILI